MEQISRVIYYSRNCIVGPPAEVDIAIDELLNVCRRENSRRGLTGALLFNRSCFAQVLEGPPAAVEATYRRIAQDKRHVNIELLANGSLFQRSFPGWSMAYVGCSEADSTRFRAIAEMTSFDPAGMSSDILLRTLQNLVSDSEGPRAG